MTHAGVEHGFAPGLLDGRGHAGPASAADVRGLAPALIVSTEFDPLRDEAENYPARLRRPACRRA
jgi:acetyl esterase/lipase